MARRLLPCLLAAACLAALLPAAAPAQSGPDSAVPSESQVETGRRYLRSRSGVNSFALLDSRGRLHGFAPRRTYVAASVVKAMLLVAYLRKIDHRTPNGAERGALGPMITSSDNARASTIYRRLGDAALRRLARRAGMKRFSVAFTWTNARVSAEDQARFMHAFDRLVPARSRSYARRLASSIVPWQRWGFSRFSLGAGWRTFFKGGWRGTGRGELVHEAALFERAGTRFSLAVLTDGNPSHEHGAATLRGVAARLFGPAPGAARLAQSAGTPAHRRAGLEDLRRYAPGLDINLGYATSRNLTGRRLPGYCKPWALMRRPAARDLGAVQRELARRGLGLVILDAYRPARASRALVRWAQRTGRRHLVGTYIARRSRHNLGSAVDLSLVRLADGYRLRMGSGYDELGRRAHTLNARGEALRRRLALKRAMERHGFRNYHREWWHYEHRARGTRYLDLTLGC